MFIEIKLAKELDEKIWIDYLKEIGNFNHFHTPHMCKFYSNYKEIEDISFFCFEKKKPVAFVPLAISSEKERKFSFGTIPCHTPIFNSKLSPKTKRKLQETVYKLIFDQMKKKDILCGDFFYHPIQASTNEQKKSKIEINYKDSFSISKFFDVHVSYLNTNIIDLTKNIDELEGNLQPQIRNELKKDFFKNLEFSILNSKNSSEKDLNEAIENYKKLHFSAAGRITRSSETWVSMNNMLKKSKLSIFFLKYKNSIVSGQLSTEFFSSARCSSQASIKDEIYKKYSLRHFLEWNVIKYYKNLKFNYYCLGHSFYFSTGLKEEIDDKHKRIGLLKTKFGGDQYPEHFFRIQSKNKNAFEE